MVENKYSEIAVFEDDLRFEPYFRTKLDRIMDDIDSREIEWDLMCVSKLSKASKMSVNCIHFKFGLLLLYTRYFLCHVRIAVVNMVTVCWRLFSATWVASA